jgi:hypothetical protein
MLQHMDDDANRSYFQLGRLEDLDSDVSKRILRSRFACGPSGAPPMGSMRTGASSYDYNQVPGKPQFAAPQKPSRVPARTASNAPSPAAAAGAGTRVGRRSEAHTPGAAKRGAVAGAAAGLAGAATARVPSASSSSRTSARRGERSGQPEEAVERWRFG